MTQAIIYSTNILGAAAISNPLFLFTLLVIFYFILFIFYHYLDYPLPSFFLFHCYYLASILISRFYFCYLPLTCIMIIMITGVIMNVLGSYRIFSFPEPVLHSPL